MFADNKLLTFNAELYLLTFILLGFFFCFVIKISKFGCDSTVSIVCNNNIAYEANYNHHIR